MTPEQREMLEAMADEESMLASAARDGGPTQLKRLARCAALRAALSRPAPPDDLAKLAKKWRDEAAEYPVTSHIGAEWAATAVRMCAAELERAIWVAPAPAAAPSVAQARDEMVEGLEAAGFFRAPLASPTATDAFARWLRRTKPHPEEWRSRDGELPQMGGGTAGYLDALQAWNEAREAVALPPGFEANTAAFSLQNFAAPAPETPADEPFGCAVCHTPTSCAEYGCRKQRAESRCKQPAPETPAPDAMPECPNCGGMGTTFHDILVGGTEHDTEERCCEVCRGTGKRRQEAQP